MTTLPSSSAIACPDWSCPRSGPGGTPSASAVATSKRPGRAAAAQEERRRRAAPGRHRPGGAEEDEIEIHSVIVPVEASGALRCACARRRRGAFEPWSRPEPLERLIRLGEQLLRLFRAVLRL